jgi:DNA-binding CsgD family transcriptional regulator
MNLTERQREVLARIREGKTDKEIGAELFIGEEGVAHHLRKLFAIFSVHSRLQLVLKTHERVATGSN